MRPVILLPGSPVFVKGIRPMPAARRASRCRSVDCERLMALQEGDRRAGLQPEPYSARVPSLTTSRKLVLFRRTARLDRLTSKEMGHQ